mgnify:CR=1 FL=1
MRTAVYLGAPVRPLGWPLAPLLWLALLPAAAAQAVAPAPGFDPLAEALDEVARAHGEGRYELAFEALGRALAEVPEGYDAELLLWQARLSAASGRFEQALEAFERLSTIQRGRSPEVRLEHARALRAAGRSLDAAALLETLLDNYPRCGPARLELADLLLAEGQLPRAEQELERLLAQAPELPRGLVLKARVLSRRGESEGALALLRAQQGRDDAAQSLRAELVEQLLAAGRAREAWLESKPLLAGAPRPRLLELAGAAAIAAGEPLEALAAYSRALANDPAREGALDGLAYLFERAPDVADAIALARARAHPEDARAWQRVLRGRVDAGRGADAFALYESLAENLRADPELKLEAVAALRGAGRLAEGLALVAGLCPDPSTATPHGPRAWYERGLLEFERLDLAAAERCFERAAFGPLEAEALFNRGLLQLRGQRYAEAARSLEAALTKRRDLSAAWLELGHIQRLYLGDRAAAEASYRAYLELVGRDAEIEALLGEAR